jgi:ribosomal protein L11 methylase PrmA
MLTDGPLSSSFRDPSGYVFAEDGKVFRFVSSAYAAILSDVAAFGLLDELWSQGLLVRHSARTPAPDGSLILEPEQIPTISYPYEWCFSQLKAAALLTLSIQASATAKGFSLKDASAYNVQFLRGKPIFIDTLSFEAYEEGSPWRAYRQFCEHFLAPLALMSQVDPRLNKLMSSFIDGIPLDIAAKSLPLRSRLSPGLAMHLHLHSRAKAGGSGTGNVRGQFSKTAMLGLIDSLKRSIQAMVYEPKDTVWGDYYQGTNYSDSAFEKKKALVRAQLQQSGAQSVWDLGANTGTFSMIAAEMGLRTVAWDFDSAAVEKAYRTHQNPHFLPLLLDLTNPSPALGWANEERSSFQQRCDADAVMALALIHHLAIGNNVPLERVAAFFAGLAPWLIIEFVPKSDSQVQRLLSTRDDIYPDYQREGFVAAFGKHFRVVRSDPVEGSERELFLMARP